MYIVCIILEANRVLDLCDKTNNETIHIDPEATGIIIVNPLNYANFRSCQLELKTSVYWRFQLEILWSSLNDTSVTMGTEIYDTKALS